MDISAEPYLGSVLGPLLLLSGLKFSLPCTEMWSGLIVALASDHATFIRTTTMDRKQCIV